MKIHFLGTHHAESKNTRLASFLVDEFLAVDAGSLTSELSFLEQTKITDILLSHQHYDHIRAVPSFIFNNLNRVTNIFATSQTLEILSSHLFDGVIYPKFTDKTPFLEKTPIKLITLKPYEPVLIKGYNVLPLPVNHTEGSVGFEITSKNGKKLFYTGDTGPGLSPLWDHISPQLVIMDLTFPNKLENTAKNARHLCPKMLKKELKDFQRIKGYLPQVIVNHLNPEFEEKIKLELSEVSKDLNFSIDVAFEGEKITV